MRVRPGALRAFPFLLALAAAGPAVRAAGTLSFCVDAAPEGFDMAQYETTGTFDGVGVPLYEQLTRIRNDDATVTQL